MSTRKIERELRAANPVKKPALAALDLDAAEAALGAALFDESAHAGEREVLGVGSRHRSRGPRPALLALAAAAAIAAAAVVLLVAGGGGTESPPRAYGAELVRFAQSTPLLLLEAPGWRVKDTDELADGQGTMEFVTGESGHGQHWVTLDWSGAKLSEALKFFYGPVDRVPGRKFTTTMPTLGTKVHIDTRAETSPKYGGPGDHEMLAVWAENGHVLELSTRVPDLAAFRERLGWLHRVGAQAWLNAMPAKVVKAAEYGAAARGMLHGIPLPPGFDAAKIPDLGLTTDRYQVGAAVGGAVACAWFRSWGEARASHDAAAAQEAERVLLNSAREWPIFRAMRKEGAYPAIVVEYAKAMPSGRWYGRPLLSAVDSEGGLCGPRGAAAEG